MKKVIVLSSNNVVVPSEEAGDGSGQVWSVSSHKVRKDALHLPSPLRCFAPSNSTPKPNLPTAKPHVGLSNNHLNPVYMNTWPLFMSKKPVLRGEQKRKLCLLDIYLRNSPKLWETEGVVKRSLSDDIIKGTDRPIPPSTRDLVP